MPLCVTKSLIPIFEQRNIQEQVPEIVLGEDGGEQVEMRQP